MDKDNIHIFEYLHLLRRRQVTLLVSFASVFLLVCLVNFLQKPIYRAGAELMVEKDKTKLILGSNILAVDTVDDTYFLTQQRVIRSRPVADLVVSKAAADVAKLNLLLHSFGLPDVGKDAVMTDEQKDALAGNIQGALALEPMARTRIFRVTTTGSDRHAVALLANLAAEAFIEINMQSQLTNAQQAFLAFTSKLQELKDRLNISEFALQKLQLELKLVDMLKVYEDKHPEVIRMKGQIEHSSNYLRQELGRVRQSLGSDAEVKAQRESVLFSYLEGSAAYDARGLEEKKSLAMFLEQEVSSNREIYNTVFKKMQEINLVDQASANTQIKIVEQAGVPSQPLRPNKKMNLLFGCVVGITLGIGLAFFQDYLDNTIKTSDDVTKYLRLAILGIIPAAVKESNVPSNGRRNPEDGNPIHRLMTMHDSMSPHAEAYRTLRTNVLLASIDKPLRTLLVTSSVQKEGKSTTAINLAISVARSGSKVLLVDADLRRPILAKTFNIHDRGATDLVDVLTGEVSIDKALYPSGIENLTLLPCTKIPPNPSELLGSGKMLNIIDALKNKFDLVLFDSPPLVAVTDAVVLSSKVDGVVFVTKAGAVPRGLCAQAKGSLDNAKANILGAVMNNVNMDQSSYNYYHYYRHYNSYTSTPSAAPASNVMSSR